MAIGASYLFVYFFFYCYVFFFLFFFLLSSLLEMFHYKIFINTFIK